MIISLVVLAAVSAVDDTGFDSVGRATIGRSYPDPNALRADYSTVGQLNYSNSREDDHEEEEEDEAPATAQDLRQRLRQRLRQQGFAFMSS